MRSKNDSKQLAATLWLAVGGAVCAAPGAAAVVAVVVIGGAVATVATVRSMQG